MTRKRSNTRQKTGGRKRSLIKVPWDAKARRRASDSSADWHGTRTDIAYPTEGGAKGQAPKRDGIVIAKHGDHSFFWYQDPNKVPLEYLIISIRRDGKWQPVDSGRRFMYTNKIRRVNGILTNITDLDAKALRSMYDGVDYTDTGLPPDLNVLQPLNKSLRSATQGRASATYAGSTEDAEVYYIHYWGRPTPSKMGTGPRDQIGRTERAAAKAVIDLPFIIGSSYGDISGAGDYVTNLVVFKEHGA